MIKPGVTFGALEDFINGFGSESAACERCCKCMAAVTATTGLCLALRTQSARACARFAYAREGNAFVWKPTALSADGEISLTCGGPVIVTENGCESLFKRAPGLVSLG